MIKNNKKKQTANTTPDNQNICCVISLERYSKPNVVVHTRDPSTQETEAVNDAGVSFYWEFTTGVGCPKLEANPTVENKK